MTVDLKAEYYVICQIVPAALQSWKAVTAHLKVSSYRILSESNVDTLVSTLTEPGRH